MSSNTDQVQHYRGQQAFCILPTAFIFLFNFSTFFLRDGTTGPHNPGVVFPSKRKYLCVDRRPETRRHRPADRGGRWLLLAGRSCGGARPKIQSCLKTSLALMGSTLAADEGSTVGRLLWPRINGFVSFLFWNAPDTSPLLWSPNVGLRLSSQLSLFVFHSIYCVIWVTWCCAFRIVFDFDKSSVQCLEVVITNSCSS